MVSLKLWQQFFCGGWWRWLRKITLTVALVALVTALLLRFTGALAPKIPAGSVLTAVGPPYRGPYAVARLETIPETIRAVGTVRPIEPVVLTPRITGRVVYSALFAGARVHRGEVLLRLDDVQLKAELAQAVAAVFLAKAQLHQARIDQRRDQTLLATGDVTRAAMDLADTKVAVDRADVARALAARKTARTVLGYATICSPLNGLVMRKFVSVGDMALPGQALADLYDPRKLQLAAVVREALASDLRLGQKLPVRLEGLRTTVAARIREIVPRVNARTRSFTVKAAGVFPAGVWPGMYGTLRIPTGQQKVLVIPAAAIRHVGELDLVTLVEHGRRVRQTVQPGRRLGALREILAGLTAGQRVVIPRVRHTLPAPAG